MRCVILTVTWFMLTNFTEMQQTYTTSEMTANPCPAEFVSQGATNPQEWIEHEDPRRNTQFSEQQTQENYHYARPPGRTYARRRLEARSPPWGSSLTPDLVGFEENPFAKFSTATARQ